MEQNQLLMNLIDDFDKRNGKLVEKFTELAEEPSEEEEESEDLSLSEEKD
jgi:hypothetical protein